MKIKCIIKNNSESIKQIEFGKNHQGSLGRGLGIPDQLRGVHDDQQRRAPSFSCVFCYYSLQN